MGGNALKEYGVKRVNRETYTRIQDYVLGKLQPIVEVAKIPYFIDDKVDFGDVDVLSVIKPVFTNELREWIENTFKPRAIIKNSNVFSFNVEDLQIDLITTSKENFDAYFNYLCWGDLSMVLGRVSRLYDLKYGIYGLEFPVRDPETNHVIEKLTVSKDPKEIYDFLGYDYARWKQGFNTSEDVRDFLFSSDRIHQDFLTKESENRSHRKRDKQDRTQFIQYYKWFQENRHLFPEESAHPVPEEINARLEYILKYFPNSDIVTKYNKVHKRIKDQQASREKFSGKHLKELFPELEPKEFGMFMQAWNNHCGVKQERVHYVLNHSVEELTKQAKVVLESMSESKPT